MDAFIHNPASWVGVAFILFCVGFIKLALPFILKGLDSRSAQIKNELDQAVALREEAQAVLAEYQQKQREILTEAEGMLRHAKQEAEAIKVAAEATLKEDLERRTRLAHDKISRAEADAIREIRENIVDIATTAAHRLIVDHLESAQGDDLVEVALENVDRIVH